MARTERGLKKMESSLVFKQITPPHGWKQDSNFHYLRLTLPGFEAKDITIHMDKYGHLVVRGNKQVTEHKHMSFEETYDVPSDANLEDASGMFEDGQIYRVDIPKVKQRGAHAITIPQEHSHNNDINPKSKVEEDDDSLHRKIMKEGPRTSSSDHGSRRDYLKHIRGDKKKTAFFIAILIALLLLIIVVIIVKFRHR